MDGDPLDLQPASGYSKSAQGIPIHLLFGKPPRTPRQTMERESGETQNLEEIQYQCDITSSQDQKAQSNAEDMSRDTRSKTTREGTTHLAILHAPTDDFNIRISGSEEAQVHNSFEKEERTISDERSAHRKQGKHPWLEASYAASAVHKGSNRYTTTLVRKRREKIIRKREKEKEDFINFLSELFDERHRRDDSDEYQSDANLFTGPSETANSVLKNDPIKKEIQDRNHDYSNLIATQQTQLEDVAKPIVDRPMKKETLHAVPIEQLNFKVMNAYQNDVRVDVVAVHGLGAIPDITWKEKVSGIDWLSDAKMLPSAIPKARILRFGYDSLWFGKTPIVTSLSTIARKMLLSLNDIRAKYNHRPLVFIGHCFGGLVIQRALNIAKMLPTRYPGVFESSVGIVFLGTPNRGTSSFRQDSALLAAIAASSDLSQKMETGVLSAMSSDDGTLLDVSNDFIALCKDNQIDVCCFYEQRSSKPGKRLERHDIEEFIVDEKSATFNGYDNYGLGVDHFGLNKFHGPLDPSYTHVRKKVVDFYKKALEKAKPLSRSTTASSLAGQGSSHPQDQLAVEENEDALTEAAIRELEEEEAQKEEVLIKKRLQNEKHAAEQEYLNRVKKNMAKYKVQNPDEILRAYPLPNDEELNEQEIIDKEKWHKNVLKGELLSAGLNGGQIDEILNHTGEVMTIDGFGTAFTRMARKWISKRTLKKYRIPFQVDDNDKTSIIVKRWVPDYEKEFLWDHSHALRGTGDVRKHRKHIQEVKAQDRLQKSAKSSAATEKDWVSRMFDAFKEKQKSDSETAGALKHPELRSMRRVSRGRTRANRDGMILPASHRRSSRDSIHSAPDLQEVEDRRRHSFTLSHSQEREPIARLSDEFGPWNTYDDWTSRLPSPDPGYVDF